MNYYHNFSRKLSTTDQHEQIFDKLKANLLIGTICKEDTFFDANFLTRTYILIGYI